MSAPHPFLSHRYPAAAAAAIAAFLDCQGWVLERDYLRTASCQPQGLAAGRGGHRGGGAVAHGAHCCLSSLCCSRQDPGAAGQGRGPLGALSQARPGCAPIPPALRAPPVRLCSSSGLVAGAVLPARCRGSGAHTKPPASQLCSQAGGKTSICLFHILLLVPRKLKQLLSEVYLLP